MATDELKLLTNVPRGRGAVSKLGTTDSLGRVVVGGADSFVYSQQERKLPLRLEAAEQLPGHGVRPNGYLIVHRGKMGVPSPCRSERI